MKKTYLTLATAFLLAAGTGFALEFPVFGQNGNRNNQTACPNGGICDGSGSGKGARNGRKAGPRDGSGPIHQPGTGGGSGAGKRGGRR